MYRGTSGCSAGLLGVFGLVLDAVGIYLLVPGRQDRDVTLVLRGERIAAWRKGVSEVVMRYSGCDHNGFDDGLSVRSLTAEAVAPFVAAANRVFSLSGPREKVSMLAPDRKTR